MCFLCCYFLMSLCLTRQYIAISIVLYSTTLMHRKKYLLAGLGVLVAFGFHSSALIGFVMMFLYIIGNTPLKKRALVILSVISVLFSFFFREILVFLVKMLRILPERYISKGYMYLSTGYNFSISRMFYVVFALLIVLFVFLHESNIGDLAEGINSYYLLYMMIISLAGVLISSSSSHIYRITLYCEIYTILIFPNFIYLIKPDLKSRVIGNVLFVSFLISYGLFTYMIKTGYGVWPYVIGQA